MTTRFKLNVFFFALLAATNVALAAAPAAVADTSAADTETVQIIQVPGMPPAETADGARAINPSVVIPCTPKAISPLTGASGTYVANVCATVGGVGKFSGTGAAKHVIFNNLTPGSRPHVFTALKRPTRTVPVTIPAGKTSSTCSAVKFNSAGGLNYTVNIAVGFSTFPGTQFCP